jgi:hypothetical protein
MALFAALNGVVLQVQATIENDSPPWQALRFFSISGALLNIGGTTVSVFIIMSGKEAILNARRSVLLGANFEIREAHLESGGNASLLRQYNLNNWWRTELNFLACSFLSSVLFLLITMGIWAWLTTRWYVASTIMVVLLFSGFPLTRFLVPMIRDIRIFSQVMHSLGPSS